MGILHFDFDGGQAGELGISRYWWMYAVVAVPLTAITFWVFFRAVKSHKNVSTVGSQKVGERT